MFILAIIAMVGIVACGDAKKEKADNGTEKVDPNYPKDPEGVTTSFISNWFNLNYEEAGKYYNGDFSGVKEIDEKMGKEIMSAEFEDIDVLIDGEKATVTYIDKTNEKRGEIGLVKIKGQWKVQEYMIDSYINDEVEIDSLEIIEEIEVITE